MLDSPSPREEKNRSEQAACTKKREKNGELLLFVEAAN